MSHLDPAVLCAWQSLLSAHARVTRAIDRDLAAAGLPDLRWHDFLASLARAPGRSLRVSELAQGGVLTQTAMSRFVDRAEREGLVGREPDPRDRRATRVVLTDRGAELLAKMEPVHAGSVVAYFAAHVGDHGETLRGVLEAMAESARHAGR